MSKQSSQEENDTIHMMKLFQDNVKQDITSTSSVIKIVEEKLKDCSMSLASLKQVAQELNIDYKNLESQVNNLGFKIKKKSSPCSSISSLSRTSSLSSFVDNVSENLDDYESSEDSELDDLESTYIFVKSDGEEALDDIKWNLKKRSSVGTVSSSSDSSSISNSTHSSDEDECVNFFRKSNKVLDENAQLIKMLLKCSTSD